MKNMKKFEKSFGKYKQDVHDRLILSAELAVPYKLKRVPG